LPANVRRGFRLARYLGLDAGARPEVLDELLAHVADPRFAATGVGLGAQAIRQTWARPLEEASAAVRRVVAASAVVRRLRPQTGAAIGQHIARFCAVENAFAALVRLLKGHAADALGIELSQPRARELYLVDYVPAAPGLTRTVLRDLLGIEALSFH
jgi:hypothetical protein